MPTQYLSLGYPSNKWWDIRKAINASSSWGLELPSPKQSLCPSSGNLFLCLHPHHLHTPSKSTWSIKLALEPLSPPTLVSSKTSLQGAFLFLVSFGIGFFRVFFIASSRNFTILVSTEVRGILITSPSPKRGSLNIS